VFKDNFNKTAKNSTSALQKLNVQQMYLLYKLLNTDNKNINKYTLMYIYINTNLCRDLIGFIGKNLNNVIIYYFLFLFFFFKTLNIGFIQKKSYKNINTLYTFFNSATLNTYSTYIYSNKNYKYFISKKTPNNFLEKWKKIYNTYSLLGLVKLYNTYTIIKANTTTSSVVSINKPLLVSPKYSSTSICKLLPLSQDFEFQFLRKNKVYNKGRYSRCRQNYRTGVYMCMYLSVVSIFGIYYTFYRFSFNFTYLWWFFICFVGSFFLPKIIKYRLYEPTTLFNKFIDFFKWVSLLLRSFL